MLKHPPSDNIFNNTFQCNRPENLHSCRRRESLKMGHRILWDKSGQIPRAFSTLHIWYCSFPCHGQSPQSIKYIIYVAEVRFRRKCDPWAHSCLPVGLSPSYRNRNTLACMWWLASADFNKKYYASTDAVSLADREISLSPLA